MRIGGLARSSLIDYPGKVAAVVFTQGCDFRCPFCHNPDLASGCADNTNLLDESDVLHFLWKRRGLLDGVVLTGGEPTLQPDLRPFLRKLKDYGYLIKLDTNGSRPEVLQAVIQEGLADFLAMDLKAPLAKYYQVCGAEVDTARIEASMQLIRQSGLPHEFRTTAVRPLHSAEDLLTMGRAASGSSRFVLQRFVAGRLLDPAFAETAEPFGEEELKTVQAALQGQGINCYIR